MTLIGLDRARTMPVVGELITAGMAEHVDVPSIPRSAPTAARSIGREKPAADSGAPRSEATSKGED